MSPRHLAFTFSLLAPALAAADAGICKLDDGVNPPTNCTSTAPPLVSAPSGMGQYCSVLYPGGGGSFTSNRDLTGDPCAGHLAGGTIAHAGMYSLDGMNGVVMRCSDGHIGLAMGYGQEPLTRMYNDAVNNQRPSCSFLVSPQAFPVFTSPFPLSAPGYLHSNGFDFAQYPYYSIDLKNDFQSGTRTTAFQLDSLGRNRDGTTGAVIASGSNNAHVPFTTLQVGSTSGFASSGSLGIATKEGWPIYVTYSGKTATSFTGIVTPSWAGGTVATGGQVFAPSGYVDEHQGHDYVMDDTMDDGSKTSVRAVADGVIDLERHRDYRSADEHCDNGTQGEIYIRHRFSGGNSRYDEVYETYYAHWASRATNPRTGQLFKTGDVVYQGETIAYIGHSGCTGGVDHLHFGVFRLSNTAAAYSYPMTINTQVNSSGEAVGGSDYGYRNGVEPDGFYPPTPTAFDPWAWRGIDNSKSCDHSTFSTGKCDRGAQSVNLWKANKQPPLDPSWISSLIW